MYCTEKHPAKLRQGKDKAKLISTNDANGFTYRGRFVSKKEAISIGYETSQKIHNALRWLIQKQASVSYTHLDVYKRQAPRIPK